MTVKTWSSAIGLVLAGLMPSSVPASPPVFVGEWPALGAPHGVAVAPDGNVLVTEPLMERVEEFTPAGVAVRSWGSAGSGPGQFSSPVSIAINAAGNVLVTDYGNGRVQEFTRLGGFVRQYGNGILVSPGGIATDSQGNVFVAEWYGGSHIAKFTSVGTLVRRFDAGSGAGQSQFMDVAIGPGDELYALDGFGRIMVFTNAGDLVTRWGGFGSGPGELSQPEGLAMSASGHVFVADTGNNRVQEFTPDGSLLAGWGGFGSGPGRFWAPTDVVLTTEGLIYVADKFNNRVQVFANPATATAASTWGRIKAAYRQSR